MRIFIIDGSTSSQMLLSGSTVIMDKGIRELCRQQVILKLRQLDIIIDFSL